MRNYFKILLLIMLLALLGCGSGTTSGDPLGTDTITVTASVPSLSSGQSSVITATVKHADGRAATGRAVSFSFAPNNSGGTITTTDDGKNNGVATAVYTAGTSTPTSSVQDTVRASIENGAAAAVFITRAAVPGGGLVGGQIALFTASKLTVSAGQSSILTANVTDGAGAPLSGVTVAFSIPTINSGAPTLSVASAVTDGTGNAITIYSPGTASPTTSVEDNVQASLTNGSSRAVTITRSGNAAALANVISNISTSQTTLSAGQNSIVAATVTDTAGKPVSGQTVTFSLPIKGSGAPTLSATSATTDGSGNAITIYSPGTASATTSVEDMVQASITSGSTRAVSITRSGTAVAPTVIAMLATLSPSQTTLTAGQSSIITANVTDSTGNPVSGQTVTFAMVKSGSGVPTLSTAAATTDGRGNAITIYSPGSTSPTTSVDDIVQASLTNGSTRAVSITRSGTAVAPTVIAMLATLSPSQTTLTAGQSSIITANVTDSTGNPVSGQTVTFAMVKSGSGVPTLSTAAATTDGRGNAITIYSPGSTSPTTSVDDIVQASLTNGSTRAVSITRSGTAVAPTVTALISALTASAPTVTAGQNSIITATVTDSAGNRLSGQTVSFAITVTSSGAPTLSAASATTDASGIAITIYTPGVTAPTNTVNDMIQASLTNGSTRAVSVTRSGRNSTATSISTLTSSKTTVTANQSSIITAKVTDSAGNPISGETVTFTLPVTGSGVPTLSTLSVVTDGSGNAVTVYKPGVGSPTDTVDDAIQATLTNGSSQAVIVTRSNQAATGNTVALTSSCGNPGVVVALNSCVITATVKNASGSPVSGVAVTFAMAANGTGAPALIPVAGTAVNTDGSGNANTIYTAGGTALRTDVITATISGGDAALAIAD